MIPSPHVLFVRIEEKIDDNHYSVTIPGGQRVEAFYYRTSVVTEFNVGDQVFIERLDWSHEWVITAQAFGDTGGGGGGINWFQMDDGPGFDTGHLAP